MATSPSVVLSRLWSLKDMTPFMLLLDSASQSSTFVIEEILYRVTSDVNVISVTFELQDTHPKVTHNIRGHRKTLDEIQQQIENASMPTAKNLIIIDTLAFIKSSQLTGFLSRLIRPNSVLVATHHTSLPALNSINPYAPSTLNLLHYFATTVISVSPTALANLHAEDDRHRSVQLFSMPPGLNSPQFEISLVHRRKSGRSTSADFAIDTAQHTIKILVKKEPANPMYTEDESLLRGLTTFNLGTTDKQKAAKDNVDLPFLAAQEFGQGGAQGGAIIYEFEKDDDYDEEDPYEDPF
ncbi:hypothetical protein NADFUDRAFT_83881 [Nadsonia fulvescens var. elongata DSM 6958]|uniref:Elongator complex protein 5 n=1 Tax=Nadsonia fulvescens var. elongata DSM 6958 TaxID=857566 RepID=A0A1E3PG40_9ASCO|nr:hypothetical protein NADFUDRAFT_83881 [Nadsonia fulvescens var. elongata DSM 6958]